MKKKTKRFRQRFLIIGAVTKLGGDVAQALLQQKLDVSIISTKKPSWITSSKKQILLLTVKNYRSLPSVLKRFMSRSQHLTILYFLSTGGKTGLTKIIDQVIDPVVKALSLQGKASINSIFISSQLSHLVGFEKNLAYHMEKAALETAFKFFAIRDVRPARLYNVIRLSHVKTEANKKKYEPEKHGVQMLKNVKRKDIEVTDLKALIETIIFLSSSDLLNGLVIDLDQGARYISSVSENSGYTDTNEPLWFLK